MESVESWIGAVFAAGIAGLSAMDLVAAADAMEAGTANIGAGGGIAAALSST
jgi:hypothetical protein